jgi:hypothetical protein
MTKDQIETLLTSLDGNMVTVYIRPGIAQGYASGADGRATSGAVHLEGILGRHPEIAGLWFVAQPPRGRDSAKAIFFESEDVGLVAEHMEAPEKPNLIQ